MDPLEPLHFGNFQVMQRPDGSHWLLGEGAYGRTYKAKHRFLKRICALKIIHDRHMQDREKRARFLQEARTAAQLSHPGVAQVYDFGEESGVVYYAMEFCEGGTLEDLSKRRGAMDWAEVAGLARQMAEGLACAHGAGLLHRDLKPQNVMLASAEGPPVLKLIDFGLVKVIAPEEGATWAVLSREGGFKGNYATASPEQTAEKDLDERSDLFSFGVILWWLLLGKSPFEGMSHAHLISDRLSRESYASRLPAGLDPKGSEILARLLEKEPDERFGSARDVSAALKGTAGSVGIGTRAKKPKPAAAVEPVARSAPGLFEETFEVVSVLDETQAAKLYQCRDGAGRSYGVLIPTPHASEESVEAVGKLARSGMNYGCLECFGDWRTESEQPAFVFGDMSLPRMLDALKSLGDAPFADVAPVLGHLAACIDRIRDDHGVELEINPHFLRVGGEAAAASSWGGLDAASLRVFPRVHAGELPADYSADSTILSSDTSFPMAAQFGTLVYRLVSGIAVPHAAYITSDAYIPAASLSEKGNHFLERVISGELADRPTGKILRELAALESVPVTWTQGRAENPTESGPAPAPLPSPPPGAAPAVVESVVEVPAPSPQPEVQPVAPVEPPVPPPAVPEVKPAKGGKRSKAALIVVAAVAACLALAAWPAYLLLAGSDQNNEDVGDQTWKQTGDHQQTDPQDPETPGPSETRVEFSALSMNYAELPDDARFVLCDHGDGTIAELRVGDGGAVADGVPAALFEDAEKWPLSLKLEAEGFIMEPVALETGDFRASGGERICSKAIKLEPRALLEIAPLTRINGAEIELPGLLIQRHLKPAGSGINWGIESDGARLRVTLPTDKRFPVSAELAIPFFEEQSVELPASGRPVWDLATRRKTVKLTGLGNFQRLLFSPDHEAIQDPELRDLISTIMKPRGVGTEILDDDVGSWELPVIDGTVEVAGSGRVRSFPLAATARWKVLSDAGRSGDAPQAGDAEFRELIALAEQGEIGAQFRAGLHYLDPPNKNPKASTGWFRMAAIQGRADAQNNLARAYQDGIGVEPDPEKAARWFREAAEQQFILSQNSLGMCYRNGDGVERDPDEAEKWFLRAADQDDATAMFNLAVLHSREEFGKLDEGKARDYFHKAAERGDNRAQYSLGLGYKNGYWGLEKSREKAIEFLEAAARNGYAEAEKDLRELRGAPGGTRGP
jgi:tRNA A-37 threonylcarbamoyl transferase component Bud32